MTQKSGVTKIPTFACIHKEMAKANAQLGICGKFLAASWRCNRCEESNPSFEL